MPQIRPGRTRSKRTNRRPALHLSSLDPQDYNVRDGEVRSIACPSCRTWRRLMGESKLKVREHGDDRQTHYVRCDGSNQVVIVDIDVRAWQRESNRLLRDGMWADKRHAAREHSKPVPEPAKPVARMAAKPMNASDALVAYRRHLRVCRESGMDGRCGVTYRCTEGAELARWYARMQSEEPWRQVARAELAATRAKIDARYQRDMAQQAREEWQSQAERGGPSVRLTKRCAKPSGTEIEELNNLARSIPGSVSDRGRPVPLKPARVTTR